MRSNKIEISEVNRGVSTLQDKIKMIYWNKEGFKVGICKKPPLNQDYSILALCNSTGIKKTFQRLGDKFDELYKRKAYTHVYQKFGAELDRFEAARENCNSVMTAYQDLEKEAGKEVTDEDIDSMRFKPLL